MSRGTTARSEGSADRPVLDRRVLEHAVAGMLLGLLEAAGVPSDPSWRDGAARQLVQLMHDVAGAAEVPVVGSTEHELARRFVAVDLEILLGAINADLSSTSRLIARAGGRTFVPAQAEIVERLRWLREVFDRALLEARNRDAGGEIVILREGSPGSGRYA